MWWKNKQSDSFLTISPESKNNDGDAVVKNKKYNILKIIGIFFLILFFLIILFFGSALAVVKAYQDKVYPGVYLGHFHVGRMSESDVKNFFEGLNNRLSKEGIVLTVKGLEGKDTIVKINTVLGDDSALELVEFQGEEAGRMAISAGRTGAWWQQLFSPLYYLFFNKKISVPLVVNAGHLIESLQASLAPLADKPHNANIKILNLRAGQYEIIPEKAGSDFVYSEIVQKISDNLSSLSFAPIDVFPQSFAPQINSSEAAVASELIKTVFGYGNLGLNYIDPQTKIRRDWLITTETLSNWIVVKKDNSGQVIISLNPEEVRKYLENLRLEIDKPAQDAKFSMEDGRVKEFQASQSGLALDVEKTMNDILFAFEDRNYHPTETVQTIGLTVNVTEPNLKMSEVNDLGIEDILGVGVSSFKGSHENRIKNIALAVKRVNGTLVRPGEEFSALKAAGPFTPENGFLPELVIKGNEIKKEIGGGMCQIGTTLFRMAMNAGMPITERRNHSLVVNYYADPVNGNPGTDATLYEPILDFKFLNDTGHYLLVQTAIDYKKQELTFTLWGKNDGRKGWYTHPLVSKWIPPGEPQEIKTDKLKPGVRECQDAYRGAVASFTYSRITPSGEKIDRVFESYYRPLPRICMVGIDPNISTSTIFTTSTTSTTASTTTPLSSSTDALPVLE